MSGIYTTLHQWQNGGGLTVNIEATATNSPALPTGTTHARLLSTVDCWIELGGGATASAGSAGYLSAFSPEYVPIPAGALVSVLRVSTNGVLYVKPCCG